MQLEAESGRRAALEKQLGAAALAAAAGGGGPSGGGHHIDIEAGERSALLRSSSRGREEEARCCQRLLASQVRHPKPALLQAAAAADDALAALDRLALGAGRHLRVHRPLRLGAMAYLALLHGWLVVLLVSMVPAIEPNQRHTRT